MTREEQDKRWNDLSEEDKAHYREQYAEQKTISESGVPKLLEDLFGSHNINPELLTYEDICKKLFGKGSWQFGDGYINDEYGYFDENANEIYSLNMTSQKQANKLLAINKLLNIAKYLNGDWTPDWENDTEPKWYLCDFPEKKPIPCFTVQNNSCIVYFRTEELAQQAIQILGEETIRLALSTDF